MSKLDKRAISILIIALFMLSMMPIFPAHAVVIDELLEEDSTTPKTSGVYGDVVRVLGYGVTSGAVVNLYFDYVTEAGLVNNTDANPDGTFEVWFTVPEAVFGNHYIWAKDLGTGDTIMFTPAFQVSSLVELSPASGLYKDEIDVSGYGFDDDNEITMTFAAPSTPVTGESVGTGDGTTKIFTLNNYPVLTGEIIRIDGVPAASADYSIDYPTGTITFVTAPGASSGTVTDPGVANTGNGILAVTAVTDAPETWTVSCTDATTVGSEVWSVTGITSGLNVDATTGVAYTSDLSEVSFMITAGATAFIVGDDFEFTTHWVLITADYSHGISIDMTPATPPETSDIGSFESSFTVPDVSYGTYYTLTVEDEVPNTDIADFTVGASISLDVEEGPEGTVIEVSGEGFTAGALSGIFWDDTATPMTIVGEPTEPVQVSTGGTFTAEVVAPSDGEGDHTIIVEDTIHSVDVTAKFTVDGVATIEVTPTYGSPGATITVSGANFTQIADTKVYIELWSKNGSPILVEDLVTAETESDGTFEDTFTSPAVAFVGYDVRAEDTVYDTYAEDAFKVGLIAMIINPEYGSAGTEVSLTGIGFLKDSTYNLTFGDKLYEDYGTGVSTAEAISDIFYVPNVEIGTYDVTVIDEDENELTRQFMVTAVTEVELDPAMAPIDYNVTIEGYNFADYVDTVDFVLYNSTDEWEMDVTYNKAAVETGIDGNFTGHWKILPELELSLGDYTINVTGYDDFLLQVPFSVVEARVSVAPRKALFDRGDTIQFNVKNDFKFVDSYMKIWDPYDNLYWRTEDFDSWLKVGDLHTVPYYLQTSGMNPMTLSQDAPLGTWFYVFYETGTTELTNGTFVVGPSAAAQVDQKLTEIWASMEGITENIDSITDELAGDISDLSGDIDDVVADVQDMVDDITADLAEELAGVAEDTEAAVGELEDSIGDIASAQNALQSDIEDMSQDTAAAKKAAEDSQQTAQGLTTLVYGAIAASLIAALAAVVSLMQISKKIA